MRGQKRLPWRVSITSAASVSAFAERGPASTALPTPLTTTTPVATAAAEEVNVMEGLAVGDRVAQAVAAVGACDGDTLADAAGPVGVSVGDTADVVGSAVGAVVGNAAVSIQHVVLSAPPGPV